MTLDLYLYNTNMFVFFYSIFSVDRKNGFIVETFRQFLRYINHVKMFYVRRIPKHVCVPIMEVSGLLNSSQVVF